MTLPDLCSIPITDGTHQTPTYAERQNGIPFLSSKDVTTGKINWSDIKYITKELHQELYKRVAPFRNDILLAKNGTTGIAALVDTDIVFDIYVTLALIRPVKYISPRYLLYVINSRFCKEQFNDHLTGIGLPNLHLRDINKTFIPLPPIEEQQRIVAKLDNWFEQIENLDSNREDLQRFIQQTKSKVLSLAIHGKLVPQDSNDEPAIELLKRINPAIKPCDTSHYENLPKGWCIVRLDDIYNHTTGKALKKSNTYGVLRKYITTSNLYWNSFDLTEVRSMYFTNEEIEKCTVHKGDLLLCNGGDVGRAAIWNYDYDICIQNHISRLRPKYENTIDNLFYYYILMYLKQKGLLNGKGVAITSLSAADLLSIPVPLPPKKEQVRIVQKIQEIENLISTIITD